MVMARVLDIDRSRCIDFAKIVFVAPDILLEGQDETLGMLGRENNSGANLRPGGLRLDKDKINDEFRLVVVDHREVGISPLGHILVELNFQLEFLAFVVYVQTVPTFPGS